MALLWTGPAGAGANRSVTWSPNLHLRSTEDIPNRLRELEGSKRVMFTNGQASREVGTCDEYLNAVSTGFYPATNYANKMSAPFVHDCFVLRDLQHARAATSSISYDWSEDSLTHLPPVLVPGAHEVTDAAEQAGKRGETWKQFNPTLRVEKIDSDSLLVEDDNTVYFLVILARGDFNGDGVEDIAIYGSAQEKHSTWAHDEYLILSPTSNGKLVRLTDDRAPFGMKAQIPD
jgi:hypothetical protein